MPLSTKGTAACMISPPATPRSLPSHVLTPGATRPMQKVSMSAPYSSRALEDARLGYVSPYPPVQATAGPSAGQSRSAPTSNPSTSEPEQAQSQAAAENVREFTFPSFLSEERRRYQLFPSLWETEAFSQAQRQGLITALNEHRVNTVVELRRIERIFEKLRSPDLTQPMTSAWRHYVQSNSLLTELRALTRNYPFSSECLNEAKRRVSQDPASNRSWNYCWLVLVKIHTDGLIHIAARAQATRPEMWGGRPPPNEQAAQQLAQAFVREWTAALQAFLRHWETPPVAR